MKASGLAEPIALPLSPGDARHHLRQLLLGERWDGDIDGVLLAFHEALVNAHQHGGGATRAEACIDGTVLMIRIWDKGPGFEASGYQGATPDAFSERGRGLWLISHVVSHFATQRDQRGVYVELRFGSGASS